MARLFTDEQVARLAATQTDRCSGCGTASEQRGQSHGYIDSQGRHQSCPGNYQVGPRVDFDLWQAMCRRYGDFELFDRWASGEPCIGLPSWFNREQLSAVHQ